MKIESLEPRRLCAGDVRATFSVGRLTVVGDDAANALTVSLSDTGVMLLTGQNGTTVNGQTTFAVGKLKHGSTFSLKGGNDALTFSGVTFTQGVAADGGVGDDVIQAVGSTFGAADWYGSAGRDTLWLDRSDATARLRLFGGADQDHTGLRDVRARRGFDVSDSGPKANVGLLRVSAAGVGAAASYAGTSAGRDTLDVRDSDFEAFSAKLKGGNDKAYVRGTTFATASPIDGSTGADTIDREIVVRSDFSNGQTDGWEPQIFGRPASAEGTVISHEEYAAATGGGTFGIVPAPFDLVSGTAYLLSGSAAFTKKIGSEANLRSGTNYRVTLETEMFVSGNGMNSAFYTGALPRYPAISGGTGDRDHSIEETVGGESYPIFYAGDDSFFEDALIDPGSGESLVVRKAIQPSFHTDAAGQAWLLFEVYNGNLFGPYTVYFRNFAATFTPRTPNVQ